jgi:hypothetical protein
MKIILLIIAIISFYFAYQYWEGNQTVTGESGIVAPKAPIQQKVTTKNSFYFNNYKITPLATFKIKARVLNKKRYRFSRSSSLSPVDLVLGWGQLSDDRILQKISISQSDRFYFWSTKKFPIPKEDIINNTANMHLIPTNPFIKRKILKARRGDVIIFRGYLVKVQASDGWQWSSSLFRDNDGQGACELVWVEEFDVL